MTAFRGTIYVMEELPVITKGRISIIGKWLSTLGVGLMGNWIMTKGFDLILYPFVIYMYGMIWGGLVMLIISFLATWGEFVFYDWAKRDWLGLEALKGIKDFHPKFVPLLGFWRYVTKMTNFFGKLTAWLMRKSDVILMIFLSIQFEPFIAVIYMRKGVAQYDGLSRRDWTIFLASVFISNAYWTLAVFMGISIVEAIWASIIRLF